MKFKPRKPPMKAHNNASNPSNKNNANRHFPTKPPLRMKNNSPSNQHSNASDPLIRLFIRDSKGNTPELVIWNNDATEIEQTIAKFCAQHAELSSFEHEIQKAVLELLSA